MLSNKKLNPLATELLIRGRKLSICLICRTQSYFAVLKNVRLNWIHYFVMKIANKRASTNGIYWFTRYWPSRHEFFKKMYWKTIFIFTYWYCTPIKKFFMFKEESFRKNIKMMIRLKMKNYNVQLTKKQQKYQDYYQVKLRNMNILQVKRYWHLIKIA